ncbi:hypothetical protein DFH09DRAFT_1280363 [Mycena vulgaris]|nr:hypothetical protein DFH09DRAFT_1280363 [Mycena vulgaris]
MSLLRDPSYDSEPPSFEEQFHYWVRSSPTRKTSSFPPGGLSPRVMLNQIPRSRAQMKDLLFNLQHQVDPAVHGLCLIFSDAGTTQSLLRIAEFTPDYGYAPLSANELLANKFESGPLAAPPPSEDALRDFDSALEILRALIPRYVVDIDRLESRAELRVYYGYPVHPWQGSFKAPLTAQPELKGEPASAMSNEEFEQRV